MKYRGQTDEYFELETLNSQNISDLEFTFLYIRIWNGVYDFFLYWLSAFFS